jgi:hypothetical protein
MVTEQDNLQAIINRLERDKLSLESRLEKERQAYMDRIREINHRIEVLRDTAKDLYEDFSDKSPNQPVTSLYAAVQEESKRRSGKKLAPSELLDRYLEEHPGLEEIAPKHVRDYFTAQGYKSKAAYMSVYQAMKRSDKLKKSGRKWRLK